MAWNEPGGGKRNPWGQSTRTGRPELDEASAQLAAQARPAFRRGRRDGPRPSEPDGVQLGTIALLIAADLWGAPASTWSMRRSAASSLRFGRYVATREPGLALAHPVADRDARERQRRSDRQLHRPDAHADLRREPRRHQHRSAISAREPLAYALQRPRSGGHARKRSARARSARSIGRSKLDFVLGAGPPGDHGRAPRNWCSARSTRYKTGIEVTAVNLQDVSVPDEVAPSQRDAIKAREDRERLRLEAQAYANDILPKAARYGGAPECRMRRRTGPRRRGRRRRSRALLAAARPRTSGRPDVTRQRLYIETIETCSAARSKVLLDTKARRQHALPADRQARSRRARHRTLTLAAAQQAPADRARPRDGPTETVTVDRTARRGDADGNRGFLPSWSSLAVAILLLVDVDVHGRARRSSRLSSRFGEIVRADYKPGLHFKMPFVNNVRKFERRIITRELPVGAVPHQRRQDPAHRLLREVAHHRRRRITTGPRAAARTMRRGASGRSSRTASRASSRAARSSRSSPPSARRSPARLLTGAGSDVRQLGVELVDVRVQRIDLPEEVSDSVLPRMRQGFAAQAATAARRRASLGRSDARRSGSPAHRDPRDGVARRAEHARRRRCARRPTSTREPTRATRSSTVLPQPAGVPPLARASDRRRAGDRARQRVLQVPEGARRSLSASSATHASARDLGGSAGGLRACIWCWKASLPFLNPRRMKRALMQARYALEDRQLRIAGLASMLAGAVLLYLVCAAESSAAERIRLSWVATSSSSAPSGATKARARSSTC